MTTDMDDGVVRMGHSTQTGQSRCSSYSAVPSRATVCAIAALLCLGPVVECLAFTTSPPALTFTAVQGSTNPPNQTLSISRTDRNKTTLADSDNASWLSVSPAKTSLKNTAQLTVAVSTSGLAPGTYNAMVTIRVGTWTTTNVPVMLTVSPASPLPPPPPSATTATLAWSPVTDSTLEGYKVYVGTASGLYSRTITVGNLTSYVVDSLTTGTTYFFTVTAYNSGGESPPSNEVSKSIY